MGFDSLGAELDGLTPPMADPRTVRADERRVCVVQLELLRKARETDEHWPSGHCCLAILDEAIAVLKKG